MIETSERGLYGRTLYCNNAVTDEVTESVKNAVAKYDEPIYVSFDVTGRTCHLQLGALLESKLGKEYDVDLDYMSYKCAVTKKEVHQ